MNNTELDKVRVHHFHHYIGIEEIDVLDGKARISIDVDEKLLNPSGTLHGGILYSICDVTSFCALLSSVKEGEIGVTNSFSIQVMRAARENDKIDFEAEVVKLGKRLAFIECSAHVGDKLIAKACVTKSMINLK